MPGLQCARTSSLTDCNQGIKMNNVPQHYVLRWNNHSSNFITVFDHLLRVEAFTDVTVAGYDGVAIKCHKMVLAASSLYFQELFMKNPCEHPIIILSDVKHSQIRAILDYMYKGEVNVAQDQLSELLKVAEFLKVKGLIDDNKKEEAEPSSSPPPAISTSTTSSVAHSSGYISPPHLPSSSTIPAPQYATSPVERNQNQMHCLWTAFPGLPIPQHPISGHQPPTRNQVSILGSSYENDAGTSPLSRKKLSSHRATANRDTPILRTVLGQNQADSSQPMSESSPQEKQEASFHCSNSNGSAHNSDRRDSAELSEDERRISPQNYTGTNSRPGGSSTRPEWKRYKQYTRENIMDAMNAVRERTMSALQAARYYKVPSRTLYDKLKKAGILPSRGAGSGGASTQRLSTSLDGSSARFPYSGNANGHVYGARTGSNMSGESEAEINGFGTDASFARSEDAESLHGGAVSGNGDEREDDLEDEAMDMSRHSPSPPPPPPPPPSTIQQLPPALVRSAPVAAAAAGVEANVEDEVEDLSVSRGSNTSSGNAPLLPPPPINDVRVIVPTLMKKEEIKEELPEGVGRV